MSNEYNNNNTVSNNNNSKFSKSSLAVPVAIVVGFGLIALSIYFSGGSNTNSNLNSVGGENANVSIDNINPITEADHIRGNPNAPLVIVEYSDFDCPFCRSFHITMNKIMDEYGPSGKVAWVYRHFPLTGLHPSAAHIAEASECVAELGGNDAFWKFTDSVFMERGVNDLTDVTQLPKFAVAAGVADEASFKACLETGDKQSMVEEDFNNAASLGAQGTPYSVIIVGDQKLEISGGAVPYEQLKVLIDGLLK